MHPIDNAKTMTATCTIAGVAGATFGSLPLLVGTVADGLRLSDQQAGYLPSAMYVGYTIAAVSAFYWVRRYNFRVTAAAGIVTTAASYFAAAFASSYYTILLLITICGFGIGVLYSISTTIVSDSRDPNRAFGMKLGVETVPGVLMLFVLPAMIIPRWGFGGVAVTLGGFAALTAITIGWLPKEGTRQSESNAVAGAIEASVLAWLSLIPIFLFFSGIVGVWSFLERYSHALSLDPAETGIVLAGTLIASVVGGFAAASVGSRFGESAPIKFTMFIYVAGTVGLWFSTSLLGFGVSSVMLLFTLNLGLTFLIGSTARFDVRGNFVVLTTAAITAAVIVGPVLAGYLIEAVGYGALFAMTISVGLCALGLHMAITAKARRLTRGHAFAPNSQQ
jgi:predicted MFS family arabinose efflux permease